MQEGWINRVEPFYLPEEAFYDLEDAYVWRGRVRKRFGASLIGATELQSRFRINLGTTNGAGNLSGTVPGTKFRVGQMFSIGVDRFIVNATGTPANLLQDGGAATATYNTTTGAFVFAGASATTAVYFYPADPVMGLLGRETSNINAEQVVGFDTQFSYIRSSSAWERLDAATVWTGSDSQFFWSTNYRSSNPYDTALYVVNYNTTDNIKYINSGATAWTNLRPQLNSGATRFLETCRVLVNFKDRLVALNTIEDETGTDRTYQNRARFSQNGDPTAAATAWLDDVPGRGGYIDAPTQEAIITAERLKDRLIVYFERSTWELVYTAVDSAPFKWQQINDELGCESSFSVIGFDKQVLGVGNVGVHACNGVNVTRIDEKIPNEVFRIHNGNNGPERVYGIRDYYNELVYWTFPSASNNPTFPTRILIYNYENGTWAVFNDSYTCFGNFQGETDLRWDELGERYGTWENWNDPWGSPLFQSAFPFIIAGNQEGWVHIIDNGKGSSAQSLQITDMTSGSSTLTIVNHNLQSDDYILIEEATGVTSLNGIIVRVSSITDANNIVIDTAFSGTYTGAGKATRISNIRILSKSFNPGTPIGQQFSMPYADFLLDRTTAGQLSLEYYLDTTDGDTITEMDVNNVLLGSNILYTQPEDNMTFQPNQNQIWHRYYIQAQGGFIQLLFYMSDTQMKNYLIATSWFELHAILLYVQPQGRITG